MRHAVADAVNILQTLDNPVVEELFQQQGDRFTVIGNRRRLLPFLRRRFEGHLSVCHADTFNQSLAEHIALRHLQQLEF